ncbi:hypothetical protein OIU74_004547 [Salix koriyanagi]|uniref:Uncharacterized protein n=1 Tax=Salix koriyanagi TaxID=2511006 RepID=A0A9Q0NHV2_9ROSI|nr:hypothetical protein OIU74_004547 [Salix koriyanagi]
MELGPQSAEQCVSTATSGSQAWLQSNSLIFNSILQLFLIVSDVTPLTDFSGTPNWMAPEVINYSDTVSDHEDKEEIWVVFDSHDHEKHNNDFNNKKFSKEFKDMVVSCLDPSAD